VRFLACACFPSEEAPLQTRSCMLAIQEKQSLKAYMVYYSNAPRILSGYNRHTSMHGYLESCCFVDFNWFPWSVDDERWCLFHYSLTCVIARLSFMIFNGFWWLVCDLLKCFKDYICRSFMDSSILEYPRYLTEARGNFRIRQMHVFLSFSTADGRATSTDCRLQ
jgi:hypothetical protein